MLRLSVSPRVNILMNSSLLAVLTFGITIAPAATLPSETSKKKETKSLLAYVFDERFSVVRARPDVEALYLRRLRVGHRVFILTPIPDATHSKFRRVVVSRNFTGWMLAAAVAAPGIAGDDEKLFRYAETQPDDKALIALKILTSHFDHSPRRPAALLRLAQLAEGVARQLSVRANRKLSQDELALPAGVDENDLFGNFRGLDHFSSYGIRFIYQKSSDRYLYCGDAYKEILRKYPHGSEATTARGRLKEMKNLLKE